MQKRCFINPVNDVYLHYRVVKLHTRPSGMCFCTEKGDLLVGIGGHVYKIPHENCRFISKADAFIYLCILLIAYESEKDQHGPKIGMLF